MFKYLLFETDDMEGTSTDIGVFDTKEEAEETYDDITTALPNVGKEPTATVSEEPEAEEADDTPKAE